MLIRTHHGCFMLLLLTQLYLIIIGIQGDETSHRFADTWDTVYTADSLTRVPWLVIAGNHDYKVCGED